MDKVASIAANAAAPSVTYRIKTGEKYESFSSFQEELTLFTSQTGHSFVRSSYMRTLQRWPLMGANLECKYRKIKLVCKAGKKKHESTATEKKT